jgi:hypothetical protein
MCGQLLFLWNDRRRGGHDCERIFNLRQLLALRKTWQKVGALPAAWELLLSVTRQGVTPRTPDFPDFQFWLA